MTNPVLDRTENSPIIIIIITITVAVIAGADEPFRKSTLRRTHDA